MSQSMQWVAIACTVVVVVLALVKLFKVFNSPAGERYLRQQTQGPFAPVEQRELSSTARTPSPSSSSEGAA